MCSADFTAPSENQVLALAHELLGDGHAVAVSCGGDPETLPDGLEGPRPDVWRHAFRGRLLTRRARRCALAFSPSLVHAFSPRLPVLTAARKYAADCRAPLFVHFEDDEWGLAAGRPGEPVLRRVGRPLRRIAGAAFPPLWPFVTRPGLGWIERDAAGIDSLTPLLCEEVSARLGRSCRVVLPPATPASRSTAADVPELPGIRPDTSLVLYTGAVFGAHLADFELALAAVGRLRQAGRDVALVQAGRTAPRFDLPAFAREHGLSGDGAAFIGYRSGPELEALTASATVLVQPGHPNDFNRLRLPAKLPGYLRSGVPTVTFAVGAGELLEDRREVLKTHTGEPGELAERIAELLDDAALRATLSQYGPLAAERLFAARRAATEMVDHYRSALAGRLSA